MKIIDKIHYYIFQTSTLSMKFKNEGDNIQPSSDDPGIYFAFRPTILFAMFFGMVPLQNATRPSSKYLKFKWLSFQTCYTLVILISLCFIASLSVLHFFIEPPEKFDFTSVATRLMGPLFYTSACVSLSLTLNVTRKLPEIFQLWDIISTRLVKYIDDKENNKGWGCCKGSGWCWSRLDGHQHRVTIWTTSFITICFMSSAIFEHTLHDVNFFEIQACGNNTDFVACQLVEANNFVKSVLGYHPPITIAAYFLNKFANFAWNFHDLFLIQLSVSLTKSFKVISNYLNRTKHDFKSIIDWRTLREDHLALCELVEKIDGCVAPMVLLSYAVSIYYLAHQIFLGIRPESGRLLETVYVLASFGHLVGRVVSVSFAAASMYDEVIEPLQNLHSCPANAYNKEVHRFINQIVYSTVGFTGCKFFVVNRNFILGIVSIIVTYELLLLDVG